LPVLPELKFSEHPLAQAIVNRAEGFEPHKAEGFKSIMGKPLQDVWFVRTETVFVGKLEFIRKSRSKQGLKRLLNN
jgi:Cd2+/Zn2+-exporting ATPase